MIIKEMMLNRGVLGVIVVNGNFKHTDTIAYSAQGREKKAGAANSKYPKSMENLDNIDVPSEEELFDDLGQGTELAAAQQDALAALRKLQQDFAAYRQRAQREIVAAKNEGVEEAAQALFALVDGYDRALSTAENSAPEFAHGIKMLRAAAIEQFEQVGIYSEFPDRQMIDPRWHEVLSMQDGDFPTGTVLHVVRRGWRRDTKLLQAAQVIVCRGEEPMPVGWQSAQEEPKRVPSRAARSYGRWRPAPGWSFPVSQNEQEVYGNSSA